MAMHKGNTFRNPSKQGDNPDIKDKTGLQPLPEQPKVENASMSDEGIKALLGKISLACDLLLAEKKDIVRGPVNAIRRQLDILDKRLINIEAPKP